MKNVKLQEPMTPLWRITSTWTTWASSEAHTRRFRVGEGVRWTRYICRPQRKWIMRFWASNSKEALTISPWIDSKPHERHENRDKATIRDLVHSGMNRQLPKKARKGEGGYTVATVPEADKPKSAPTELPAVREEMERGLGKGGGTGSWGGGEAMNDVWGMVVGRSRRAGSAFNSTPLSTRLVWLARKYCTDWSEWEKEVNDEECDGGSVERR